ncbi:hypothetical protein CALVIDRAFT_410412 [Calocera viscosa TUFC12733]|uniref:Aminoglycoside phosphotransferase domain-containing protein n=1 Tax=Calocera viscosa (strain TUFC12733) TaxID=1330018 RepID=A0A167G6Y2_CALVF|nr:hypothetical protein CALVIDRAFT_410412 [Calocera viscosa TUFC12733]
MEMQISRQSDDALRSFLQGTLDPALRRCLDAVETSELITSEAALSNQFTTLGNILLESGQPEWLRQWLTYDLICLARRGFTFPSTGPFQTWLENQEKTKCDDPSIEIIHRAPRCHLDPSFALARIRFGLRLSEPPVPVWRISRNMVLKETRGATEALTCLFLQKTTDILIPEVWIAFRAGDRFYMVSRYIEDAKRLDQVWSLLPEDDKVDILVQLSKYIRQLRVVELPRTTPGPLDMDAPCTGVCFGLCEAGPFRSSRDLFNFFEYKRQVCLRFKQPAPCFDHKATFRERLAFVHQDLHPSNLLVDNKNRLYLLDWAESGCYPRAFEACAIGFQISDGVYETSLRDLGDRILLVVGQDDRFLRCQKSIRWALINAPLA